MAYPFARRINVHFKRVDAEIVSKRALLSAVRRAPCPNPKKPSEDDETDEKKNHGEGLVKTFQEIESDLLRNGEGPPDTGS